MSDKKIWKGNWSRPVVEKNAMQFLLDSGHKSDFKSYLGVDSPNSVCWYSELKGTSEKLAPSSDYGYTCPECGARLFIDSDMMQFGETKQMLYWPQCIKSKDRDHGYGMLSKHRTYRQYDKKPRDKRDYKPVDKTPEPSPSPTPAPEKPKTPDLKIPDVGVTHERFADVFRLIVAGGVRAILLEGPAGSGKTSMVPQLVRALSIHHETEFGLAMVNGNAETEASQIGVFKNPHDGTEKLSAFMRAATDRQPHVCLIDEVDAIQPGNLLVLNAPSANRYVVLDGKQIEVNPLTVFVITANATNGANRIYTGRFPMDGATKSRFLPVFCDYSPAIDKLVCSDSAIRSEVNALRKRVNNDPTLARNFGALVGTRLLIQSSQVGKAFGKSGRDAVVDTLRLGNSQEALTSLGY